MKTSKLFLATGLISLLIACGGNNSRSSNDEASRSPQADSINRQFMSSSAAVETGKDSTRKFIRTADLKFKVKNVINATYEIENITNQFNGFVTYTKLNSLVDNRTTIPVSADSSLETTYFTVENSMTLSVPNVKLDTTLKTIASLIDYLDYRIIKADDIAIQYLSNQFTQNRVSKSTERITNAIDERGKKLNETTSAEELLLNKQEQSDNAKIANLSLQDKVNFSTVTINIYQRQSIKRELIPNDKNIDAYSPGLGTKIGEALKTGWKGLEAVIVFLAEIWVLIILGIVGYVLYRKFGHNFKKG